MKSVILIIILIFLVGCYDDEETVGKENSKVSTNTQRESYVTNVGDNAWHNSTDRLCPALDIESGTSANIWSDTRGVFVSVGGEKWFDNRNDEEKQFLEYGGEIIGCYDRCPVGKVLFNDGNGWQEVYGYGIPLEEMRGIPNGALLFYGPGRWYSDMSTCGLYTFEDGDITCVAKGDSFVQEVFAVNDQLAYARMVDGGVMKFDGISWEPLAVSPPRSVSSIWANEEILFAGGLSYSQEEWKEYETTGDFDYIWGFAADDIWAVKSSPNKIYHFDGKKWETVFESWPFRRHESCEDDWSQTYISGIWGSDGVLFIFSERQIARLENGKIDLILDLPCVEYEEDKPVESNILGIASYWGNSKNEVFVLVWDGSQYGTECGTIRAMFYDGINWNWM